MATLPATSMEKSFADCTNGRILDAPSPVRSRARPASKLIVSGGNIVKVLSAPQSDYKPNPEKTLQLCYELQKAEDLLLMAKSASTLSAAADAVTSLLKPGALAVVSRSVGQEHPFTFSSVNGGLKAADEVAQFPLVVELVVKSGCKDRMFVRVRTNLDHFDGVGAFHASLQVLEYLEHKGDMSKISPYPFTDKNGSYPGTNFGNFARSLGRVLRNSMSSNRVQPGEERQVLRFNNIPSSTKFRDISKVVESVRTELNCEGLATTVNYSPDVAVAILPDMATLQKSREEKLNWISLPPMGAGAPPPMGQTLATVMGNLVFFNNYGKHDPNISAEVTDFIWDWVGLVVDMPPATVVIQIKGKLFTRWCMPTHEMQQVQNAGLLECLGEGELTQCAV